MGAERGVSLLLYTPIKSTLIKLPLMLGVWGCVCLNGGAMCLPMSSWCLLLYASVCWALSINLSIYLFIDLCQPPFQSTDPQDCSSQSNIIIILSIHPFIHPSWIPSSCAGTSSNCHWVEAGRHPETVNTLLEKNNRSHPHTQLVAISSFQFTSHKCFRTVGGIRRSSREPRWHCENMKSTT